MERQKYNQIINKYIKKDYIINAIILRRRLYLL